MTIVLLRLHGWECRRRRDENKMFPSKSLFFFLAYYFLLSHWPNPVIQPHNLQEHQLNKQASKKSEGHEREEGMDRKAKGGTFTCRARRRGRGSAARRRAGRRGSGAPARRCRRRSSPAAPAPAPPQQPPLSPCERSTDGEGEAFCFRSRPRLPVWQNSHDPPSGAPDYRNIKF